MPTQDEQKLPDLFDSKFKSHLLVIAFVCFALIFLPLLLVQENLFGIEFSDTGQIGDTIGGIMGPFIAMGAAILTYMAFYMQYKANIDQRTFFTQNNLRLNNEINDQKNETEKQNVIQRFYEMLKIHQSNISEFAIRSPIIGQFWHGRRCFVYMFEELQMIFEIIQFSLPVEMQKEITDSFISELAYRIFFFGTNDYEKTEHDISDGGSYSSTLNPEQKKLFQSTIAIIKKYQREYHSCLEKKSIPSDKRITPYGGIALNLYDKDNRSRFPDTTFEFYYYPVNGHINRLGHSYRHQFQIVKYVVSQNTEILAENSKLDLLRMLRAQLSNHEQLLLYYNGLSLGKSWFENEYFTKWKMIHNLQLPLAKFGIIPEEHPTIVKWLDENLHKRNELFEWPLTRYKPTTGVPS